MKKYIKKIKNNDIYLWFYDSDYQWHDNSISMIYDWKIYSLEMERLDKLKHSWFLEYHIYKSIDDYYCLLYNYLFLNIKKWEYNIKSVNHLPEKIDADFKYTINNYFCKNHHYLHACSCYYSSWFKNSVVLTVDCAWENNIDWYSESQVLWFWIWNKLEKLYSLKAENKIWVWIGRAYLDISDLMLLEEWSVMWLSAYWNPEKFSHINIFDYDWLNVKINKEILEKMDSPSLSEWIVFLRKYFWITKEDYFQREKDITKSIFADIAAKIQKETEEAMIYLANKAYELTKSENLCIAWWVALNILSNTKILEKTKFKNVYISPASNDWWISLWSAYHSYHIIWNNTKRIPLVSAWIWNSYSDSEILNTLYRYKKYLSYREIKDFKEVAKLLKKENIISWFQWWSEFWPRALWFRSILASPIKNKIKDRVNKIKSREFRRPVAPSIIEEYLSEYFETQNKSPFMTFSSIVKEDKKLVIPGVIHFDWTARYHTVNELQNKKYYDLLNEFHKITSIPVLINTSFNVRWQPIVESPEDAIKTFLSTEIDYLVIWNYLVSKQEIYKEFIFDQSLVYLKTKYKEKKEQKLYLNKWNILRKILFNNLVESDFIFQPKWFMFLLKDKNFNYNIFLWKYNEKEWYYWKIKNIWIRFHIKDFFNEHSTNIRLKKTLDNAILILEKYYDSLEKIILE